MIIGVFFRDFIKSIFLLMFKWGIYWLFIKYFYYFLFYILEYKIFSIKQIFYIYCKGSKVCLFKQGDSFIYRFC